jgi:hypothetical protein
VLIQVSSPYFCAGMVIDRNTQRVIDAAPILWRFMGWSVLQLSPEFVRRGYTVVRVTSS